MKVVFVDRDGVINHDSDQYIKSADEWNPIPGSLEAIATLNRHNYYVVIISNQSGIGRSLFSITELNNIHIKLTDELNKVGGKIDAILFCPHHPNENCNCRKPKTGLIEDIANRINFKHSKYYFIGDTKSDLQTARKINASSILVLTGKLKDKNKSLNTMYDHVAQNMNEAVEYIINHATA